jgi:D-galactarolactone cycloisomerase
VLRVIVLCNANGVEVFPHSPYFGPGFLASVHICAALIERPLVEVLWLDMEANPFDLWVRVSDGKVKVPQRPGLGCDPGDRRYHRLRHGGRERVGGGPQEGRGGG